MIYVCKFNATVDQYSVCITQNIPINSISKKDTSCVGFYIDKYLRFPQREYLKYDRDSERLYRNLYL